MQLAPGDVVCVVSDGITEAHNAADALYGTARAALALAGAPSARDAVERLRDDVRAFARGAPQADDMTVLALGWLGP
jgi:serine phosphatase RsbU (regulator of sigma subunit)